MTTTVIQVRGLTKTFGSHLALSDVSFAASSGSVTAFLGPNGAGKTTTIRLLLGLDTADSGEALVFGRPYRALPSPAKLVGALLDDAGFHPRRTARNHLRVMADVVDVPGSAIDRVVAMVDLEGAADRRVDGFSLGMRRRLALASALLGDPELLVLDEPANGLDPAGIAWLRTMLKEFAREGRTVFVSSHVLPEIAQTAERVVLINRGRIVTETTIAALTKDGRSLERAFFDLTEGDNDVA